MTNPETPKNLLYCPFCKNVAKRWTHRINSGGDSATVFHAGCRNNACNIRPYSSVSGPWGYRKDGDLLNNEIAKNLADEKWNTRAI